MALSTIKKAKAKELGKAKVDEIRQYLTFKLADEVFSIGIDIVREIIEYGDVTEVPAMPPQIRGVISLRGQAVPVVDMLAVFGRGQSQKSRRTCIIIIELGQEKLAERQLAGIMVDSVNEVLDVKVDEIQPPPTLGETMRSDFVTGMGQVHGKFIMILDIAKVLLSREVVDSGLLGAKKKIPGAAANSTPVASQTSGNCPTLEAVLKTMQS